MRVLLSTIGSRGDVQPLVALGLELKELGQDVRMCVPPDFRGWIEGLGIAVIPIGPELRSAAQPQAAGAVPTPEQRRQMMEGTVTAQFDTIAVAAEGCDLILGATALQIAAPSIAEKLGIPYVFAAFCPAVLPSPHHAPPVLAMLGDAPALATTEYGKLWDQDARRWNEMWASLLNVHRAGLGLASIADVRRHVLTERPWLAADPILAPWPEPGDPAVFQTGAWVLADERPLAAELEAFLNAGDPPVYFGFGSMQVAEGLGETLVASARAFGRRAIVSRGWAGLSLPEDEPDCLTIGEVNQQALFRRVAAVVHHGGAGTTTAAARAGAPQVIIPQRYDQHYFAARVRHLGIGVAHAPGEPSADSLMRALEQALEPEMAARARAFAPSVRSDGAQVAARRLLACVPSSSTGGLER